MRGHELAITGNEQSVQNHLLAKQNHSSKQSRFHHEKFPNIPVSLVSELRAANNFPAGAGQIVRSNLFLLGHIPFLAGQTSITSYRYKSTPSPLHMMFKYETSKFSKHLLYMSIDLNAGKVQCMVQQNLLLLLEFYVLYTVSYECCQKQGSSFPKIRT